MEYSYIGYTFTVLPLQPASEILIAELAEAGFESFVETETGIEAYIQEKDWNENILEAIFILENEAFNITYTFDKIEQVNWNKEWESNFQPITVEGVCTVRAPFHETPNTDYDIVIEPKMSFGTGHHATTHMMIQHLLELNLENKTVLDMGCGTAVLGVLAEKRGAKAVDAIDIDNWCYLNSIENVARNKCKSIQVFEGGANLLVNQTYDVIIANINRNILLQDMKAYVARLSYNGILLLSGFYEEDTEIINSEATQLGLKLTHQKVKNKWVALRYQL